MDDSSGNVPHLNFIEHTPYSNQDIVEEDVYKTDHEYDAESMFTSVTDVTTFTKAGGMTQRLLDLGVDVDHLRHLRVVNVNKKVDQELEDEKFEKLSKGIRYCPECSAANKAYMDWCVECGEVLIGVEPTLPYTKKKIREDEREKKKRNSLSRGSSKKEGGMRVEDVESSRTSGYHPHASPESGRGLSLSSSPVHLRRDHSISPTSNMRVQSPLRNIQEKEDTPETKDSGRASISDMRERMLKYSDSERDDDSTPDDKKDLDEAQSDFFQKISDPVLKDFIISYRNRQMSKDKVEKENIDKSKSNHSSKVKSPSEGVNSNKNYSSSIIDEKPAMKDKAIKSSYKTNHLCEKSSSGVDISNELKLLINDDSVRESESLSENLDLENHSKLREKPRKKKKKKVMMDVEIFSYGESRKSRDFNRGNNVVPLLNFVRSSDEESSEGETYSSEENDDVKESIEEDDTQNDANNYHHQVNPNDSERIKGENLHTQSQSTDTSKYNLNSKAAPSGTKDSGQTAESSQTTASSSRMTSNVEVSKSRDGTDEVSQKPKLSRNTPPSYERHWARSSIAWSSYNPRELSTR